jgi:protein SCO1
VGLLSRRARALSARRATTLAVAIGVRSAAPLAVLIALLFVLPFLPGCERRPGAPGRYAGHGVVEDVDREYAQVLVEHDDIAGLMPAMTMNFAVPDAAVLAKLARGQVIDFELDFTGKSYDLVGFEVVGEGAFEAGWRRLGDGLVRSSPVPDFALVDQAGRTVSLADFGDRVLLVDFVYTRCPGPCPIQTARQVAIQRRIPAALHDRVHLLSFSLDPEHDAPADLERYAKAHGADLSGWSFLTGPSEQLAALTRAYGVGSLRRDDGTIDHTLVTFLVKDGRLYERYRPQPGEEERLLADLIALASAPGPAAAPAATPADRE